MAKHRPRLNVFGRQLLVRRILEEGRPVAMVAFELGVSRATAYKWLRRFEAEGEEGLLNRSSRPHRSPRALAPEAIAGIIRARVQRRHGPHRLAPLLGYPRSTIGKVLARAGYARLRDSDRASGVPIRYVREHPGELVHQDHKKLGRIPSGGGHRCLGRLRGSRDRGGLAAGYDHFEVIVDDMSRVAYVARVPDESGRSAARSLTEAAVFFAERGVRIGRVLTDNGKAGNEPNPQALLQTTPSAPVKSALTVDRWATLPGLVQRAPIAVRLPTRGLTRPRQSLMCP